MVRKLVLFVLSAALLSGAGCDKPERVAAHPALWVVHDADTTIWLFGTIHLLPAGVDWRTPPVARAIRDSDTLVTEIPAGDRAEQAKTFLKLARAPGLPPVAERIPAEARDALGKAVARIGTHPAALNRTKSWAAALTLSSASARTAGASAEHGVEAGLAHDFAGKRHLALESLAGQLGLFDSLPEPAQRRLLARSIADAAAGGYATTLAAWRSGDTRRIAASFDPLLDDAPRLKRTLLTGRNARWAAWIDRRMARPGSVFVAVGAGHLAGPGSVVAMLRAQGWTVKRAG